jgi:hypothetical protein
MRLHNQLGGFYGVRGRWGRAEWIFRGGGGASGEGSAGWELLVEGGEECTYRGDELCVRWKGWKRDEL